jgi:hypothetical protein
VCSYVPAQWGFQGPALLHKAVCANMSRRSTTRGWVYRSASMWYTAPNITINNAGHATKHVCIYIISRLSIHAHFMFITCLYTYAPRLCQSGHTCTGSLSGARPKWIDGNYRQVVPSWLTGQHSAAPIRGRNLHYTRTPLSPCRDECLSTCLSSG